MIYRKTCTVNHIPDVPSFCPFIRWSRVILLVGMIISVRDRSGFTIFGFTESTHESCVKWLKACLIEPRCFFDCWSIKCCCACSTPAVGNVCWKCNAGNVWCTTVDYTYVQSAPGVRLPSVYKPGGDCQTAWFRVMCGFSGYADCSTHIRFWAECK